MSNSTSDKKSTSDIKICDLNIDSPVDYETSIRNLGGEENLYFMMLAKFEEMSLNKNIREIAEDV